MNSILIGEINFDPPPANPLNHPKRFAYDLAKGAINKLWGARFQKAKDDYRLADLLDALEYEKDYFPAYQRQVWIDSKWGAIPSISLLLGLRYLEETKDGVLQLTEKAFALLEEPPPYSIFISYRRQISSAIALFIWSELRSEGYKPFIDISEITAGEKWLNLLEERIKICDIFITIIGADITHQDGIYSQILTSGSEIVAKEITWALEKAERIRIIPILHGGITAENLATTPEPFPQLCQYNLITIKQETSADLYAAIEELRRALAY